MEEQLTNYKLGPTQKPLEKPVGSKRGKKDWNAATYPVTTLCQDSFTIDQQELNLLRAIEGKDIPAIRKFAQTVNLHKNAPVKSLMHLLMQRNKEEYQSIHTLLKTLKKSNLGNSSIK